MSAATKFEFLAALILGVVIICAKPLGAYIADVMEGKPNFALRIGGRFERILYRICGVDSREDMGWAQYAIALLLFNLIGALIIYGLQRLELSLPLNPQKLTAVSPDSSFNTAISFITNTNWQ